MILKERIESLIQLGKELTPENERLQAVVNRTYHNNSWFTVENQWKAIEAIVHNFLKRDILESWIASYTIPDEPTHMKSVCLVLAGNIPLVGFHDILCVFVAGHKAKIKVSEKDPFLMPFIIENLTEINPSPKESSRTVKQYFETVQGPMKDFDTVIATGSNNSARYFEAYFGKYPHIIRKNRNAVAVLEGTESAEDFMKLGEDVFTYFGLGCRNVSKIYLPRNYEFNPLLEALHEYREIVLHDKYKNNFDYQFTLLILNKVKYQGNGCILMIESLGIASPIALLHYEYYDDFDTLQLELNSRKDEIQCVVSNTPIEGLPSFKFGDAQKPSIKDYADGVDTMAFLLG
jgi:Acyl-CoA reductase (LuxC)